MNPSLDALTNLAATVPTVPADRGKVAFEVYAGDALLLEGYYRPHMARDRAAFGQSVGRLVAAGLEVTTYRVDR